MATLVTIKNIGTTAETIDGNVVAVGDTLVVDLDDLQVRDELSHDMDYVILPGTEEERIGGVTFTVGAEDGANTRNVIIQVNDSAGDPLEEISAFPIFWSTDGVTAVEDPNDTPAIVEGSVAAIDDYPVSGATLISNASGVVEMDITNAGAKTIYLHVILPDGSVQRSNAIVFAA